jgi:DNA-binding NarL/FixJ family response regulator
MPRAKKPPRELEHSVDDKTITGRQLDILRLAAEGHSNRDIARELFLGQSTVDTHFQTIKWKLNARNKVQRCKL